MASAVSLKKVNLLKPVFRYYSSSIVLKIVCLLFRHVQKDNFFLEADVALFDGRMKGLSIDRLYYHRGNEIAAGVRFPLYNLTLVL